MILLQVNFAIAQTAALLPNGEQQFFDNNGNPLTSGTVDFYAPNTTNRMTTWQNAGETIVNTNPVILDAAGRAIIYGQGTYRQVVKDSIGNLIWDQNTAAPGTSSGGGSNLGDGNAVGTIKMWAGIVAPAQYQFAFGQQLLRASFPDLFAAITQITSVTCASGSAVLTGIVDTTQIAIGAKVEVSCVPGTSTVTQVTSSTITVSSIANINTTVNATIFPFGNGNGSTTFTIPDLRGYVPAGRDNMGGTAAGRLTAAYYGQSADALGSVGGGQSTTLTLAEMVGHTHTAVVNDPGHLHEIVYATTSLGSTGTAAVTSITSPGSLMAQTALAETGISVTNGSSGGGISVSASLDTKGGVPESTAIAAGGSGYTNGTTHVLTVSGGTCSVQPSFIVTTAGGVVTQLTSVNNSGTCTAYPTNPAATTFDASGTGATLNVAFVGSGAVLATVFTGGSGYTNGAQTLTVLGGTCSVQPTITVFVASNIVNSVSSVVNPGPPPYTCLVAPQNPVSVSGGGGTGATFNIPFNPGGSAYANGARVFTVQGGTCTVQPQYNGTVVNNQLTAIGAQVTASNCSAVPSNPAAIQDAGGVAASATLNLGGSGYTNGAITLTVLGGTCTTQPQFNATVSGGTVTAINSLAVAGACTINPANPAATNGGGGIGATVNVTYTIVGTGATVDVLYGPQPFSNIQPTITLNYVIKVLPDTSISSSNVVTSIAGQTGAFTCGANITCSGNVISSSGGGGAVNIRTITTNSTLLTTDNTILIDATSGPITLTLMSAVTGTGRIFNIKKIDSTPNVVTIKGNAAEIIDGSNTQIITIQWVSYSIQSNATAWYIL